MQRGKGLPALPLATPGRMTTRDFRTLDDLEDPRGTAVLVRVDLNVPMADGRVTDATRIERVVPTIRELSDAGARVVLLSHFGRPKGAPDPQMSLAPLAAPLSDALDRDVTFHPETTGTGVREAVDALPEGGVLLLENTRFLPGEEKNDPGLADAMARLGDVFVNDAFSAAHRAHVTTVGLAERLPAYAGRALQAELEALEAGLGAPKRPVMAVVGGAKVSTKLDLLSNLIEKVDVLAIGGGMANTFLAALGVGVGRSLCEHDLADTARAVMAKAGEADCEILLPVDVVVADAFEAGSPNEVVAVNAVPSQRMILDAGPKSVDALAARMADAATLVWNGPLGAFEIEPFDRATVAAARLAAEATGNGRLVTVAGGGDTVAALNHAGVADEFTYVSTAGGAFLEWMEGKPLPGVEALKRSIKEDRT